MIIFVRTRGKKATNKICEQPNCTKCEIPNPNSTALETISSTTIFLCRARFNFHTNGWMANKKRYTHSKLNAKQRSAWESVHQMRWNYNKFAAIAIHLVGSFLLHFFFVFICFITGARVGWRKKENEQKKNDVFREIHYNRTAHWIE